MKLSTTQKIKRIFIIFFTFSILLVSSFIAIEEVFYGNKAQKVALDNAVNKTLERKGVLKTFLEDSKNHLYSIRKSNFFNDYLNNTNNKKLLEDMFLTYTIANKDFMQLRYIDKNGLEQIRIDRKKDIDQFLLVPKDKLQNKANRYYFSDSKSKELEKVWFSAIDLNIERGKVQVPYNPTFRAILPIKHNGEFGGILIINYLMEAFLKKLTYTPLYDMIICNDAGETIFHYEYKTKSWGNSLEYKYNISEDFPNRYKEILSKPLIHNGTFVSRDLDLPIYGGVNLILQLKESYLLNQKEQSVNKYIFIALATLILSLLLTFGIITIFKNQLLNIEVLKRLNKEVNESYLKFKKFIDTQENIVILTDGKTISFANKQFFDFFKYEDLESFLKEHQCICELFLDHSDRFFHLNKINTEDNWIEEIQKLQHSDRIVMMMGPSFIIHSFSVTINAYNENQLIVSFSDISQTMLNQINLENKVIHDKLTKAFNREFFEQNYKKLINDYHTTETKLAIALLDIDYFKIVNDTYGHDVGDEVLIHFVNTIHKYSRGDDIFIRWGGEEFILILKVNSESSLEKALEHLRKVIEIQEFPTVGKKTCSIGGTLYQSGEDIYTTIKRADIGVYEAKENGRNMVVVK